MKHKNFVLAPSALLTTSPASIEDWTEISTVLCNIQRSVPWWLGDMLVLGEQTHGDDIYQALDETLSLDMLQRYAKVSREFPNTDRNATLSHSHHAQLASFPVGVRSALLARAELEGWNNDQLRKVVREIKSQ